MVSVKVGVRFRVYLLHLLRFYQAYCTLVVRDCYVTGGVLITFSYFKIHRRIYRHCWKKTLNVF